MSSRIDEDRCGPYRTSFLRCTLRASNYAWTTILSHLGVDALEVEGAEVRVGGVQHVVVEEPVHRLHGEDGAVCAVEFVHRFAGIVGELQHRIVVRTRANTNTGDSSGSGEGHLGVVGRDEVIGRRTIELCHRSAGDGDVVIERVIQGARSQQLCRSGGGGIHVSELHCGTSTIRVKHVQVGVGASVACGIHGIRLERVGGGVHHRKHQRGVALEEALGFVRVARVIGGETVEGAEVRARHLA
mmetsp:Transcript_7156/g.12415  ORF Transcript_7156/g.12415 Transcript_7156/m.12415 type:complete len:243 (-) Transcript_7156:1023-1751(-)